jgi:hypothetical protein
MSGVELTPLICALPVAVAFISYFDMPKKGVYESYDDQRFELLPEVRRKPTAGETGNPEEDIPDPQEQSIEVTLQDTNLE